MLTGRVKQYDQQKGWGFIAVPHEEAVYVHARGIMPTDRHELRTGDRVSLVVIRGKRGPQAARVRIIR